MNKKTLVDYSLNLARTIKTLEQPAVEYVLHSLGVLRPDMIDGLIP